jgi:hypothetical protein
VNATIRNFILRANAAFLCVAAAGGFMSDVAGIFFARGPVAAVVAAAPHSGIGLIEAHGLAFIVGVLLWHAASEFRWHSAAAAIHLLLGTANLVFWDVFVASDMLVVGYVTTIAHWLLVVLQLAAAVSAAREHPHP